MPKAAYLANIIKNNGGGFDKLMKKIKILAASKGNCTATMKVDHDHANNLGGLHSGFAATLVDNLSGLSLMSHEIGERPSVSINIKIQYLEFPKIGDELLIESTAMKVGKQMAFMKVEIFNKETEKLMIKGNHMKYFV